MLPTIFTTNVQNFVTSQHLDMSRWASNNVVQYDMQSMCINTEQIGYTYTFSDQISSLSKSCYSHIRQLRCIRPYLDSKTASTIAASIVHFKLDYCNSLYYNLPKSQINCLQQIQNCLARTKSSHITPILRSLHWLKITECIVYKLLPLTYKVLTTS